MLHVVRKYAMFYRAERNPVFTRPKSHTYYETKKKIVISPTECQDILATLTIFQNLDFLAARSASLFQVLLLLLLLATICGCSLL